MSPSPPGPARDRPEHVSSRPFTVAHMHLVFDIFQGIGIAAAVGIRPFLPALAVGALAAGGVQISFSGTDYSFLQSGGFLLGMLAGVILLALVEGRVSSERLRRGPGALVLAGVAAVL